MNMKKVMLKTVSLLLCLLFLLCLCPSCANDDLQTYNVLLEENQFFTVENAPVQKVKKGDDASFTLHFAEGYAYGGNNVKGLFEDGVLTIQNVRANRYVVVYIQKESEKFDVTITYHANGGKLMTGEGETFEVGFDRGTYLYPWTLGDTFFNTFEREGYLPVEFNTEPDGSGTSYPIGGKILSDEEAIDLYVVWQKESDAYAFEWTKKSKNSKEYLQLTGYNGSEKTVAIPLEIGGMPVFEIGKGCFDGNSTIEKVIFNKNLQTVSNGAFVNCIALSTVYMCDSLNSIKDEAFENCPNLANLRMIAALPPSYSMDVLSAFVRRVEVLYHNRNEQKQNLLFYGGSGAYHSLDGATIYNGMDGEYNVLNLGQNANLSGTFMLEYFLPYIRSNDKLVFMPEYNEFLYSNEWHMIEWVAMENFYNILGNIDIRNYKGVFTSYHAYMNGEVQFTFTPKLRASSMNYSIVSSGFDQYFTRDFRAESKPYMEFETKTLDFAWYRSASDVFERIFDEYTAKGVAWYWDNAAVYEEAYTNHAGEFDDYMTYISEKYKCIVLSAYKDRVYAKSMMYDSVVHLSTEGATENSKRIVSAMKEVL